MSDVQSSHGPAPVPGAGNTDARQPGRGLGLFSILWAGQLVSMLGTAMTSFALGVEIFQSTRSVTRFALINLCAALPILLVSPLAGRVADRFDRRRILIVSQCASAVINLVLLWLVATGRLTDWHIYPLVAVSAISGSFVFPTFGAAVTLMVGRAHLARASGMLQMGGSMAQIAGPMMAGILLLPIGLDGIIKLNIASFLVAAAVLLLVRFPGATARERAALAGPPRPANPPGSPGVPAATTPSASSSGWAFVRERPALLRLLIVFAAMNFGVGLVQVLLTPLVLSFADPRTLGLVVSIASSGALVGGTVMSVWGGPRNRVPAIMAVIAFQGALLMVGSLQANATLIAGAAFFFLLGFPITTGSSQAIWQTKTPPALQGRVFAVRRMVAGAAIPLSQAVAGPLSDHLAEPLMASGGALAGTFGRLLGTGEGRGIGLIYFVIGAALLVGALVAGRSRTLVRLEQDIPDAIDGEPHADRSRPATVAGTLARAPNVLATAVLAVLLGAAWLSVTAVRTPTPAGADSPADTVSAARALAHLPNIASRPHPVGSDAQAEVRDYLVRTLSDLGLEVEVQRADSVLEGGTVATVFTVENVVARYRGTADSEDAVLLVGHYDSVPAGPGAADNGSGVVAILETARALTESAPLRNDIVFLFTDAEEAGLHGSRAFVRDHRWLRNVAMVVNLDARGHTGPAFTFETGDDNGWWLPRFLEAAPRPYASSLMNAVYGLLPNTTDFTNFRDHGFAGFNFALIGGLTHYHNQLDRPEAVDAGSVQHQADLGLAAARMAGDLDLSAPAEDRKRPDRAHFNVLGGTTVQYGAWLAWLSAVVAVAAWLAVVVLGLRTRRLSLFGLVQGFLAAFAILVSIPVAITLLWMVVRDTGSVSVIMGSTAQAGLFMAAFAVLAAVAIIALQRFFRASAGLLDLTVGGLGWWVILVVLTTGTVLPAVSNFVAVWPLLFTLLGVVYLIRTPTDQWHSARSGWLLTVTALPSILLLAPLVATLYIALQSVFQLGGPALLPLGLLLIALLPQIELVGGQRRGRWLAVGLSIVGVGLIGTALTRPGQERHELASLSYGWDSDRDEHHWFSFDPEPGPWIERLGFDDSTGTAFRRFMPVVNRTLEAPAPAVTLPNPGVRALGTEAVGAFLETTLEITSTPRSRGRVLIFEPADAVASVRFGDTAVHTGPPARMVLRFPVVATERTVLRRRRDTPLRMTVVEQLDDLPAGLIEPRGPETLTRPMLTFLRSDVTYVRRTWEITAETATPIALEGPGTGSPDETAEDRP